ncbi:MAG: hypothetical protein WD533_06930 [Dehalococcoidia bacterium]
MDPLLLDIAREYRRRGGRRGKDDAHEELLDLYAYYTGDDLETPEYEAGRIDNGIASGAAFAARTAASALKLGPLKHPVALLARQGVKRSREAQHLVRKVEDDRELLEPLARPVKRKPRWRV